LDNEALLVALAAGAASGVSVGGVIKLFLDKAIETAIGHRYEKLLEDYKFENTLLAKRFDRMQEATDNLATLVVELSADLETLIAQPGDDYKRVLIQEFHPKYRRKYQVIRSKFEVTNELVSSFSLRFNDMLHHNEMGELIEGLKKPSEIRYVYRRVWSLVLESLNSLARICASDKRFWQAGYMPRADAWASHDGEAIKRFLLESTFGPGKNRPMRYQLSLEVPGGIEDFWRSLPTAADPADLALTDTQPVR
jgi:hypothetical protein